MMITERVALLVLASPFASDARCTSRFTAPRVPNQDEDARRTIARKSVRTTAGHVSLQRTARPKTRGVQRALSKARRLMNVSAALTRENAACRRLSSMLVNKVNVRVE